MPDFRVQIPDPIVGSGHSQGGCLRTARSIVSRAMAFRFATGTDFATPSTMTVSGAGFCARAGCPSTMQVNNETTMFRMCLIGRGSKSQRMRRTLTKSRSLPPPSCAFRAVIEPQLSDRGAVRPARRGAQDRLRLQQSLRLPSRRVPTVPTRLRGQLAHSPR